MRVNVYAYIENVFTKPQEWHVRLFPSHIVPSWFCVYVHGAYVHAVAKLVASCKLPVRII